MDKQLRLEKANRLIELIAACGRQLCYCSTTKTVGSFVLDGKGQALYKDPASGAHIAAAPGCTWEGLSQSDIVARSLLTGLTEFIQTGRKISAALIAPPYTTLTGNQWGYSNDDAAKLQNECRQLQILQEVA